MMRLIILMLLVSVSAFANKNLNCDQSIQPKQYATLIAMHDHAKLFIIKNSSDQTILLDKLNRKHQSMGAGWGSYLDAKQWSALVVFNEHFKLGCFTTAGKALNCAKLIKICRSKQAIKADSSFWKSENKDLTDLQIEIAKN